MKRSLVAAVAAVLLGVVGSTAVLMYAKGANGRALAGKQAVTVLVATKRIPAGTSAARIRTGGYAEAVPMPRDSVPEDSLSTLDESLDKLVLSADLQPRQLLLRGAFTDASRVTGGVSIPEGKIAVSVQVTAFTGPALVSPGSKIAIFDTFTESESSPHTPAGDRLAFEHSLNQVTRLLLPRVEVIAIGYDGQAPQTSAAGSSSSSTSDTKSNEKPDGALIVTVAVTQDEAERLIHGAVTGTLYIAMLDDTSDVRPGLGVDNKTLFP
jgi:pilus assembly protein CpaB